MANRYWVGGTGNWNDTAKWSDSSGGAGGQSVPGVSDVAYIDAASLSATSTITINATASVVSLIITGLDNLLNLTLSANLTCSTLFQCNGYSAINRTFIKSNTLGTARTITAATVTVTNADFQDITGADAGSWDLSAIAGGSGDCGGNTNITFTTADDWYWHEGTGNTNNYAKWYTATNGGGSQMASTLVPLPQDTLHFDANSFDSGSQTITQNMPRIGSVDFTGATNTPTFTPSTIASVFGSITLISGMVLTASTQYLTFEGRGEHTLTSAGNTWGTEYFRIKSFGGRYTLLDNLYFSYAYSSFQINIGTFDANDFDIKVASLALGGTGTSANTIIYMGSGIWEVWGDVGYTSNTVLLFVTILTVYPETSTLKFTSTRNYDKKFWISNTSVNITLGNFWDNTTGVGVAVIFDGTQTYNDFKIDAGRTVKFTQNRTTTVNTFTAVGTVGNEIILTGTSTAGWTISDSSGTNTVSYCDISYSTAGGGATWDASDGTNTDSGNNTGWNFGAVASTSNFLQPLLGVG